MNEITRLLNNLQEGEARTQEELILALYRELRSLAGRKMMHEPDGHTLQPTALVHEVWLRLIVPSRTKWESRVQFFSAAAEAMRRILVDHARRKNSLKRGGNQERVELEESSLVLAVPPDELLQVDKALEELASRHPPVAELVKLRYYAGMSMTEAASTLGLAQRTAERLWTFGRAWLRNEIRQNS
jgi:RNA polymerase sigma factor (TIGR02999 family)